jgi:hypothetical protein
MVMVVAALFTPALRAQNGLNHVELGPFFNYTRLHDFGDTNFYGIGGRFAFNIHPNIQLEAEGAYDFEQNNDSNFTTNGVTVFRARTRIIHGLFGPKIQAGTGAARLFGTVKGGLINFSGRRNFTSQLNNVSFDDSYGVLYPGGGVEFFLGPIGIRMEVGDEIYFNNGARNNLRATFGPQFRF